MEAAVGMAQGIPSTFRVVPPTVTPGVGETPLMEGAMYETEGLLKLF